MCFFFGVKPSAVETTKNLRKAQKAVAVSNAQKKALMYKLASLKAELQSICVGRANLSADFREITCKTMAYVAIGLEGVALCV